MYLNTLKKNFKTKHDHKDNVIVIWRFIILLTEIFFNINIETKCNIQTICHICFLFLKKNIHVHILPLKISLSIKQILLQSNMFLFLNSHMGIILNTSYFWDWDIVIDRPSVIPKYSSSFALENYQQVLNICF